MSKKVAIIGFVSLLLGVTSAYSREGGDIPENHQRTNPATMSPVEVIQQVVRQNPGVDSATLQAKRKKEDIAVEKAAYYPQVSAGVKSAYRNSTGGYDPALNVTASQLIYDFGKTAGYVDRAKHDYKAQQVEVLQEVNDLASDAAEAIVEIRRYSKLVDISNTHIKAVKDLWHLAQQRARGGAAARSDEVQAQGRVREAEDSLANYKSQLQAWKNELRTLLKQPALPHIKGEIPLSDGACMTTIKDWDSILDVKLAKQKAMQSEADLKIQKSKFYPRFSFEVSGDHFLESRYHQKQTDYTVGINMSIDLFQGGRNAASRSGAKYSAEASQATVQDAIMKASRSLRKKRALYSSYARRLDLVKSRIGDVSDAQKLYRAQYLSLGTRTLLDLLNTEREIYQAKSSQINMQQDLQKLKIGCLAITDGLRKSFQLVSLH